MKHPDFIKFEINGQSYTSYPAIEQQIKRLMFAVHGSNAIVVCRDYDTNEVLDELKLSELFNDPIK